jgi:hypothetical protein
VTSACRLFAPPGVHDPHAISVVRLTASVPFAGAGPAQRRRRPDYLGLFQFVHNARRRGKALLGALVSALVANPDQHPGSR